MGNWPGGFLLSALPTQPAHGFPLAKPVPLPFKEAAPFRVERYWFDADVLLAPVLFESAGEKGWGWATGPAVPAVPRA